MATRTFCDVCEEERKVLPVRVTRELPAEPSVVGPMRPRDGTGITFDACPGCWERVREAVRGLLAGARVAPSGPLPATVDGEAARTGLPMCSFEGCVRGAEHDDRCCFHIRRCCRHAGCIQDALPGGPFCAQHCLAGREAEAGP